jgi:hypothetical protein
MFGKIPSEPWKTPGYFFCIAARTRTQTRLKTKGPAMTSGSILVPLNSSFCPVLSRFVLSDWTTSEPDKPSGKAKNINIFDVF